ncbi:hypothetical protein K438DRAFT_1781358 [Mycena galopus ATCC 62051]|nr:hypothetical protein K438DRAFT_1781358 [Mycena galopus ATCC 62051]
MDPKKNPAHLGPLHPRIAANGQFRVLKCRQGQAEAELESRGPRPTLTGAATLLSPKLDATWESFPGCEPIPLHWICGLDHLKDIEDSECLASFGLQVRRACMQCPQRGAVDDTIGASIGACALDNIYLSVPRPDFAETKLKGFPRGRIRFAGVAGSRLSNCPCAPRLEFIHAYLPPEPLRIPDLKITKPHYCG